MIITQEDWFLSLSEEIKLKIMEDMLKEGEFGLAIETMKILLAAPISKGGVSTEKINEVFQKYNKNG
tara:strand:+ start:7168 stop:7368 length:201 start_codon:yes stop_codon:yes gene_type:complete